MPSGNHEQNFPSGRFKTLGILVLLALVVVQVYQGGVEYSIRPGAQALARQENPESTRLSGAALERLLERLDASQYKIECAMKNLEAVSKGLQRDREGFESRLDAHDLKADAALLRGIEDVEARSTAVGDKHRYTSAVNRKNKKMEEGM